MLLIISPISRNSFESTAAAIEKSGSADTMVGQKSGPALAGPAAPATTALLEANFVPHHLQCFSFLIKHATVTTGA